MKSQTKIKMHGYWEEYACGCTSETVKRKRDLLGYCPTHGEDRRQVFPDVSFSNSKADSSPALTKTGQADEAGEEG